MQKIIINGGRPLNGSIHISGSKNASLPIMAACILTNDQLELSNIPNLDDVKTMSKVLSSLGVEVNEDNISKNKIILHYKNSDQSVAEYDLVRKMRASVLVLGPLLARKREATVSLPGGCAIGARPIDIHIEALQKLGAEFSLEQGYIKCKAPKGLIGCKLDLPKISVGASENIIMAACLAKGQTKITNIAIEPEVIDLINCLKLMGSKIEIENERTVLIQGVEEMKGVSYSIIPDRIEALTYIIAGALSAEHLLIKDINANDIHNVLDILKKLNIDVEMNNNQISVAKSSIDQGIELDTEEFPGFPTDLQAQMMVLMSLGKKKSIIRENIFENRFMHVPELNRMGGNIEISGKKAIIHPCNGFLGAQVMATDLRASVSLVLAGLVANGETTLNRIYHLDRGYENIETKLQSIGADIKRI
tara:strand:- start:303 stop:1562 length:1260 start_codon:yes stop_codon:yes gene_type:complete